MIEKLSKRQKRKFRKLVATCAVFAAMATASGTVHAEPVTLSIAEALMYFVGYDTAMAAAAAIVSFAVSSAVSYAVGAMTKSTTGGYSSNALSDRTHMIRSSVAPRTMVYGRSMVSGPLAFIATTDRGDGPNGVGGTTIKGGENAFLHLVVLLANHEIDAVEEVYLGDDILNFQSMVNNKTTGGKFGGITAQGDSITTSITLAPNATTLTLPGLGATSIVGVVEGGNDAISMPAGGEGGTDAYGHPYLPNGGTAAIDISYTFVNATTVTVAAVNRQRTIYVTYLSKGQPASYVDCYAHLGSPSQTADAALIASCPAQWTTAHRLQGVAYLYLRLLFDPKIFPNGIPNVKALIRGKKVNDPRQGTYPNDTPAWTANYALCQMDYMKSADGLGCTDADLDLAQIATAANVCDEVVTIRPGTGSQGTVTLAMYQPRYEAHGVILLDHDVEENMRNLSTAGGGPVPILTAGKFQIPVGSYSAPTVAALTQSDLRSSVKVRPRTQRRNLFNAVGGTYVDGRISWQPTDFPEVANSFYQSQDAGQKIRRDVTFPFTTDEMMAQRLAKIMLERSRQGIVIEWPGKPSCFRVQINDLVPVTLAKFGWTSKVFRCINWEMQSNGAIDMVLQEDAAGVYDWNYGQATTTDLSKDTDLPDPSYVAPVGALTCYSDSSELVRTGDGTIISRLHVLWPATTDGSVLSGGHFEVQYKKAAEAYWTPWDSVPGSGVETWIFPVVDTEIYFVRVRAVSNRDIPTDWVYAKHTIIGNTAPPPNVTGFGLTVRADGTREFTWTTNNQPINVTTGGGYRLKYRISGSGTAWANMTTLHNGLLATAPYQSNSPPAGTYDFAIVAVNGNRVESGTPAFITAAKVGSEPVSYASAVNLVRNSDWQMANGSSDFMTSLHHWTVEASGNAYGYAGYPIAGGRNYMPWNPGRGGCWFQHDNSVVNRYGVGQVSNGTTDGADWYTNEKIPVYTNLQYEFSVYANPHRCTVGMIVQWFKSDGNFSAVRTQDTVESYTVGNNNLPYDQGLDSMYRLWGVLTPPSDAVSARVVCVKWNTVPGATGSFGFFNKVMMCQARAGVTRSSATPWIESTYDQLHGGSLQSLSVDSNQIANEAAATYRTHINPNVAYMQYQGSTGIGGEAIALGYTAVVDCTVAVIAQAQYVLQFLPSSVQGGTQFQAGNPRFGLSSTAQVLANYFDGSQEGQREIQPGYAGFDATNVTNLNMTRTYTMLKGQYAEFRLFGGGHFPSGGVNFYTQYAMLRLEVIKK